MNQLRKHDRKPMRLIGYDYSQAGLYFITICTKNREHIFGTIENGKMILNEYGDIIHDHWKNIPNHYNDVELNEYIIMPDHFHGIVRLNPPVGAQFIASNNEQNIALNNQTIFNNYNTPDNRIIPEKQNINKRKWGGLNQSDAINRTPTAVTIGTVVRSFKARCTHTMNKTNNNIGVSIWQRNYYEHIIRNNNEYGRIAEYIKKNPSKWELDHFNSGKY